MKFVMLIYQPKDFDAKDLSENEHKEVAAQYAALTATPGLKPGLPFGFDRDAMTVHVRDGETVTTPGPYTARPPGGYCEFEAESLDQAIQLAARVPAARLGGAIEVRPSGAYWTKT